MTTPLNNYYDRLQHHDWFYYMSDDHRVYRRGEDEQQALEKIAKETEEHQKMFDAWHSYKHGDGKRPELEEFV